MPKAKRLWTGFSKGELSPLIAGKPDLQAYFEGAREITNYWLLRQAGLERRPGTRFVKEVKDSTKDTLLISFEFSVNDAYILEFGDQYIRFYKNGQRLEVSGVPVEVVTPFTEAQLREVHYRQSADVLYLWHGSHQQRKLSRFSDTLWILSTVTYNPPALFEYGTDLASSIVYSAATGTGVTFRLESGLFLAGDVGREVKIGQGRAVITSLTDASTVMGDVRDNFDATKVLTGPGVMDSGSTPVPWALMSVPHGLSVGAAVRLNSGGQAGEVRRVVWLLSNLQVQLDSAFSVDQNGVDWQRLLPTPASDWHLALSPQAELNPNKKSPVGARVGFSTDIDAFRVTDVEKYIFVYAGLIKITEYSSPTLAYGEIILELTGADTDNPAATPAGTWTLEENAWTTLRGYPRTGEFYQGRLGQASTDQQPTTWWLSVSDDYENYAPGVKASDAIEYTLASPKVNSILWMADADDLFLGTLGAEFRAVGERNGEPIGGDKIPLVKRTSSHGVAAMQPVILDKSLLFVDRSRRKILVMSYDLEQDGFIPVELTAIAEHITLSGIRLGGLALRQRFDPQVFFCLENGRLIVLTYFPSEKVVGFSRITTDGSIESVATTPQAAGLADKVWVIVNRTINGVAKRYIEFFEPVIPDAGFATRGWLSLQTDSAVLYDSPGVPITSMAVAHLEGKTVDVVANGSYVGQKVVTGGEILFDEAADQIEVGLHYDSTCRTMRPAIEGSIIEGLPRSWDDLSVRLLNTRGGKVNGEWLSYTPDDLDEVGLFTGDRQITGQGWDTDGSVTIEQPQPYPMTVLALYGTLSVGR